jgi:hypothetical protein
MIDHLNQNKIVWILLAVLGIIASLAGLFQPGVYNKVVSTEILPGTISQDIITLIISVILLVLVMATKQIHYKKQMIILSFLAYLFYAYGIYVIEQLYNSFYILYLAIFTLSFWAIAFAMANLNPKVYNRLILKNPYKMVSLVFMLFIPLLFYTLWINDLLPLMRNGKKIEFTFSIYILDMAFVLPAFLISAVLIIKEKSLGYILAPILFFKAFTLLFSVGLGSFIKPLIFNHPANYEEGFFYIILSVIFLTMAVLNFLKLDFQKGKPRGK